MSNHRVICVVVSIIVAIGLLLTVILVPMSLEKVGFDEVAVQYNTITRSVNDELLEQGLHNIGPAGKLIKFKTTQQGANIKDLQTLSQDSIAVELDVLVLYSLERTGIFQILEKFGTQEEYDRYVVAFADNTVRRIAQQFTAKEFYNRRQDFQNTVQSTLVTEFRTLEVHSTVDTVQVLSVDLPSRVLGAMERTQVAEQDIQNAESERVTQLQAAQITYDLAASEARLVGIAAEYDVAILQAQANQTVLTERTRMSERTNAFEHVATSLGFGGEYFVDTYLKYLVLKNNNGLNILGL